MRRCRAVELSVGYGRSVWRSLVVAGAVALALPGLGDGPCSLRAQEPLDDNERAPRFLMASTATSRVPVPVDVDRTPVLRRRISLTLRDVPLDTALKAIARQSGLELAYSSTTAPLDRVVRLDARDITVAAALTEVLLDAEVDVVFSPGGRAMLVRRGRAWASATGTINGRVVDSATGQPISDVELRVVGARAAATTNPAGEYVLRDVPAGQQRVQARRIGYQARTLTVMVPDGGAATLDFMLSVVATRLDELVTTVTGDQRRLEVGNAISTINADSLLQTAPVMSFGDLLQGRAPGVLSLQEGGYAGQSGRIRIRGLNSLNVANDPIVVVDGVRVEAGSGTGPRSATDTPISGYSSMGGFTGRLADLDPDEIAAVEIVKGPSAATLYGTDAANGVLVITTKRGQAGRTRWTAFTEQGLLEQRLNLTDQFPAAYYAFGRSTATDEPQRCTLLQRAEGSCVVDSLGSFNTFTDPATRPFKDSWREQYGLQVSGGTAGGTSYFLSGNYEQETGPANMPMIDQALIRVTQARAVPDWQVRPNAAERVNLRANVTASLGRRGSATLSTSFISNQARQPNLGVPSNQVGYRDGNDGWNDFGGIVNERPAYYFANRGEDVVRRFVGSLATTYAVGDWLTLRGTVGADLSTNAYGVLERRGEGRFIGALAALNAGFREANELSVARYSLDLGATATRALSAAVSSKTSVGLQYNRRAQRGSRVVATDLPLGGETIAGGTLNPFQTGEATLTTAVAGGYVEEVLGFHDRLFLTGALRLDGGSAFGEDFSVTAYPKAHLSWLVTDGQVGPRLPGVSSLRLRAAYGASGVQPGPTDALALVTVASGQNLAGTGTAPGGVLVAGNPDLKPERSSELEAGLDLELWQSRVRLEFTAYQRTTTDALISRPNAASVGGSRIENLGSVRNRGMELGFSADLVRGRAFAAGFTATGALNDNELRRLGEGVLLSSPTVEGTRQEEGYPLHGLWGYTVASFADANGNGILEPAEVVLSGPNSQFIGSTVPTREATVAPYVKLFGERLHLSTLLQYRGGFSRTNAPAWDPCGSGACRAVSDPSTPLAEQARAVALTTFGRGGPTAEDGSSLLLRELSLALTVPPSVARVLGAQAGQLVLAGRNLALLWKASPLPIESAALSQDLESFSAVSGTPGPSTYWLLRVHLTY